MILVGVDTGGSKTTIAVADEQKIRTRLVAPSAGVRPGRAILAAATIADAVRRALAQAGEVQADAVVVGAAGVGRVAERVELHAALRRERLADVLVVTTDFDLAFAALGTPNGIVLLAGTGSVVVGRNAEGLERRHGGYGWQMGDEGSGYAIGRAAVEAVGRAQDGRGDPTSLQDALPIAARVTGFDQLVAWSTVASPQEIAALVPAVAQAASAGDALAGAILDRAAQELAVLVQSLLPHFGGATSIPLGMVGGLLAHDGPVRARLLRRLAGEAPLQPVERELDPAGAAVTLAAQALGKSR